MAAPKKADGSLEMPQLKIARAEFHLVGTSPLISHAWSEKAKNMLLQKQTGPKSSKKEPRDPERDFRQSLYYVKGDENAPLNECVFGTKAIAFKSSAVGACSQIDGITKVFARGAFHVGGSFEAEELVPIYPVDDDGNILPLEARTEGNGIPLMRDDMVRIGMGTSDIRFRGFFPKWGVKLAVRYNQSSVQLDQLIVLFNTAGFAAGIGDYRPERTGTFGTFRVAKVIERGADLPEVEREVAQAA